MWGARGPRGASGGTRLRAPTVRGRGWDVQPPPPAQPQAGGFLLPSRRSLLTNLSIWGKLSVRNFRSNCPGQNRLFENGKSRGPARPNNGALVRRRRGRPRGPTKGGLIGPPLSGSCSLHSARAAGRPIDWAPSPTFHQLQTKVNFFFIRRGRGPRPRFSTCFGAGGGGEGAGRGGVAGGRGVWA